MELSNRKFGESEPFCKAIFLERERTLRSFFAQIIYIRFLKKSKFEVSNEIRWHIIEFLSESFNLPERYGRRENNFKKINAVEKLGICFSVCVCLEQVVLKI